MKSVRDDFPVMHEAKTNMDFTRLAFEDAVETIGTFHFEVLVHPDAVFEAKRVAEDYGPFVLIRQSANLDREEWILDRYDDGLLTASFHSEGA